MFKELRLNAWSSGVRDQLAIALRIELWNGRHLDFSPEAPKVTIRVPNAAALRYLLAPSLYKLGTAYVEGRLEASGRATDMIAVVSALSACGAGGSGRIRRWLHRAAHTRAADAAAVRYHYDVSNDFYAAWLDPGMVYSCAYFEHGDETLAQAQLKKIDHILAKIRLSPGQRLLDIGCGWGALALRAAQRYGARSVGITLSDQQARLARERVRRAGMQHLVDIRVEDYRDVHGQFDRITSVGMFEHVGLRQLVPYFARLRALLADDGVVMNHGITSTHPDNRSAPFGAGDFITRYVFPDGELAHLGLVLRCMQEGGLEALDVENLRRHYARTCAIWSDNFEANAERIAQLVDPRHFRIWQLYLAGCAYGFAHDWISVYQVVCTKAGRTPEALPWSRAYMYGLSADMARWKG